MSTVAAAAATVTELAETFAGIQIRDGSMAVAAAAAAAHGIRLQCTASAATADTSGRTEAENSP
jgi:hypothetical protein